MLKAYWKFLNKKQTSHLLKIVSCCALIFYIGFYFDLNPQILLESNLTHQHDSYQAELRIRKLLLKNQDKIFANLSKSRIKILEALRSDNQENIEQEFLSEVEYTSNLAGFNALELRPIKWKNKEGLHVFLIHLSAVSNLYQFFQFIINLQKASLPITVVDFSIDKNKDSVFQLDAELVGAYVPISQKEFALFHQSKGSSSDSSPGNNANRLITANISCRQMKMVGYLYDDKCFFALLKLPNNKTILIARDEVLGIEKARVVLLRENQVILQAQNEKIVIKTLI